MTNSISSTRIDSSLTDEPPVVNDKLTVAFQGDAKSGSSFFLKPINNLGDKVNTTLNLAPLSSHTDAGLVLHDDGCRSDDSLVTSQLDKEEGHGCGRLDETSYMEPRTGSLGSPDSLDHAEPGEDFTARRVYEDSDLHGIFWQGEECFDELGGRAYIDIFCELDKGAFIQHEDTWDTWLGGLNEEQSDKQN